MSDGAETTEGLGRAAETTEGIEGVGHDADATGGIEGIGQIAIVARDVARATAFYRDVLGLPLHFETDGLAFLDCGGVRLMITEPRGSHDEERMSSLLYYLVDDVEEAFRRISGLGARVEREPEVAHRTETSELTLAFLRDTEDNVFALMSEKALG